jgi:muramidase (phage lysozyme)
MTPNLRAFLDLIAWSEIGPQLLADERTDRGYRVIVGSTPANPVLFTDYSTHPMLHNTRMNSDAAGRYQFMGRYWPAYKLQLNLPDFGPESQDRWAVKLIQECHAQDVIEAGDIPEAVRRCRSRWASLPGAGYGQHENRLDDLVAAYVTAGGTVA